MDQAIMIISVQHMRVILRSRQFIIYTANILPWYRIEHNIHELAMHMVSDLELRV